MRRVATVLATLALLPLIAPFPASGAGRVALVVGNSAYAHIGRLPNPANDATDVGAALQRLGFDVTVTRDAGRTALNDALRAFTRRSAGADVALVFYAGHGMEMDGINYLLPVDARIERDTDVRYETVTLDDVLAATSGAGLRVVILDACRNNPLARSMQRTVATRSVSNGSLGDLNEDALGDETLVAYSAAAGTTADDGTGRNSPYASALLAHLEEPVEIGLLFRRVREQVLATTFGRQRPHEYQSLLGEHYLGGGALTASAGGSASAGSPAVVASGSSSVLVQQETVFWESVRESANPIEIEAYLARWPNGVYAPLARTRVAALRLASEVISPALSSPASSSASGSSPVLAQQETVFWESVRESANPADIEAYLARWPNGVHAPAARTQVAALRVAAAVDPPTIADTLRQDLEVFRDCPDCPEMVVIPAGEFLMGSPRSEDDRDRDESPQHRVTIAQRFAVGAYEVTMGEWGACVSAGVCTTDENRPNHGERFPVEHVSFHDAQAYVSWLSEKTGKRYRLLSEAEWEYVARAGTTTARYWGTRPMEEHANWRDGVFSFGGTDGHEYSAPVGSYPPNDFGLYEVLGNISEWVEDCWHGSYADAPTDGSAWIRGGQCGDRVLRGGGWANPDHDLRAADRRKEDADDRHWSFGFRVARVVDQ